MNCARSPAVYTTKLQDIRNTSSGITIKHEIPRITTGNHPIKLLLRSIIFCKVIADDLPWLLMNMEARHHFVPYRASPKNKQNL